MSRKKLILSTVTIDLGCSSCRRPKLSDIFRPKSKLHSKIPKIPKSYDSDTTAATTTAAATTFSPDSADFDSDTRTTVYGKIGGGESFAVEKDSDDPYLDFRQSMLQMILENEIYSKDDLRELLNCFLQLNSPCHHGIIIRAFTEIWNGVFSVSCARNGYSSNRRRGGRKVT